MTHPYFLFAGHFYYPIGGFNDYLGRFETIEVAKKYVESDPAEWNWAHVVELSDFEYKKVSEGAREFDWSGDPRVWEWDDNP